jgi:hypothetical protein
MGLFKPAWQSKNKEKALKAVEKITDQNVLADIAKSNTAHEDIRIAAVEKITDQNVLADIAKIRYNFLYKLRNTAAEKLTEPKILVDVIKSCNESVGLLLLEKITDQKLLSIIAENCVNNYVKLEAAKKITDKGFAQEIYADVIKNNISYDKKIPGVYKLTEKENQMCILMDKISNQKLLLDISINARNSNMRIEAVKRLTDQELLADVAKSDTDYEIRSMAAEKVTDKKKSQEIYGELVKGDDVSWFMHESVIQKLTDQNILADVAINAKYDNIRIKAIKKLKDRSPYQEFLADRLKVIDDSHNEHDSNNLCRDVLNLLNDQKMLTSVVRYGKNKFVRKQAIFKLTDQELLSEIVNDSVGMYVHTWETGDLIWLDEMGAKGLNGKISEVINKETHTLDLREVARKRLAKLEK